jgi:hypothetical protein
MLFFPNKTFCYTMYLWYFLNFPRLRLKIYLCRNRLNNYILMFLVNPSGNQQFKGTFISSQNLDNSCHNSNNMSLCLNGENSPILQRHSEAMAIQKDMPKSYSNRANLIKNIMSNQVYEQLSTVNESKNNNSKKNGSINKTASDTYVLANNNNNSNQIINMKSESSVQESQSNAEFTSVPKFNGESNTLLKALLKTAPKNAVVSGFQIEPSQTTTTTTNTPTLDSNLTNVSNSSTSIIMDTGQAIPITNNCNTETLSLPTVQLPAKQTTKAPTQRKPRMPGQKKQAKMLMDLKNKILDSNSYSQLHPESTNSETTNILNENYNTLAGNSAVAGASSSSSYSTNLISNFKQEKDFDSNLVKNFSPNQNSNDGGLNVGAAAALPVVAAPVNLKQQVPRKRATKNTKTLQLHDSVVINQSNINKNDIAVNNILNELNTFGILKLSQPPSNISLLSINYPERNHSILLKNTTRFRGEIFKLKVENAANNNFGYDKKLMENILSENEKFMNILEKKHSSTNSSLLTMAATNSKDQLKVNQPTTSQSKSDSFRISSLILNEPLSLSNIKNNRPLLKNSSERLGEALVSNDKLSILETGE